MGLKIVPWKAGTVIDAPGLYSGVPMSVYHSQALCDGPSISSSGLRKIFNESPAHFYCNWDGNPERENDGDSPAFVLGRAAHHLLLGEDDFTSLFIQRPDEVEGEPWQGNRKACKAWIKQQQAAGRTILTPDQIKTIRGMARSLAAHPLVQSGILNGLVEVSMVWRCKDTGVWKKARPDVIPTDSGGFCDLKTTTSVQALDIKRTLAEYGYAQQAALVAEGWQTITGERCEEFCFAFVEKTAPYCTRFVVVTPEDMLRGERANYAAAETFKKCLEAKTWPGPGENDAEYLSLPKWAQDQIDYKLGLTEGEPA
jgi:hypothetical protein